MQEFKNGKYVGERALFNTEDALIVDSVFEDGESPLKESKNLKIFNSVFRWKYPLWYCQNVFVHESVLEETARSGIWYTDNISMRDCKIDAPKTFRRSSNINLDNCTLNNALETLWNCKKIKLLNVKVEGDYFGMNSEDIQANNLIINGNYAFDGAKNVYLKNCILNTKDAFWNCENVKIEDSVIVGEYLSWNTKNITFINCKIESHQGLCYMENATLINCQLNNTDLCFEFCKNIDATIVSTIDSVKNPISGKIKAKEIKELILDKQVIDPNKTKIDFLK